MVVRVIWTIYDVFLLSYHTKWCGTSHYVADLLHATLWMYINVVSENQIVSDLPCTQESGEGFSSESGPNGASIMDITYHVNWITALRIIIYSELRALRLSSRYYVLHTRYHCLLYQEYLLNPWLVSCIFAGREVRHLTYLNFTFQCQICMHHVSGLMTVDVCVHHLFGSSLDGRRAFLGEHIDE